MAWYDPAWLQRFKITSDNTLVNEAVDNLVFDLADAPANFWNGVKSDGGDIRVTEGETTEVAREITGFNVGNTEGLLFINTPTLSTSVDTDYYVYYNNPRASEPAASATYGRENVWDSNYLFVCHGHSKTVLNSCNSAASPSLTDVGVSVVDFGIHKGLKFTDTTDKITVTGMPAQMRPYSHEQIVECTVAAYQISQARHVFGKWNNWSSSWGHSSGLNNARSTITWDANLSAVIRGQYLVGSANTTYWQGGSNDTTNTVAGTLRSYRDGTERDTDSDPADEGAGTTTMTIADHYHGTVFDMTVAELRVSDVQRSANYFSTQYNVQSDPTTFWTVAAIENGPKQVVRSFRLNIGG